MKLTKAQLRVYRDMRAGAGLWHVNNVPTEAYVVNVPAPYRVQMRTVRALCAAGAIEEIIDSCPDIHYKAIEIELNPAPIVIV